jgi:hypothetical protein
VISFLSAYFLNTMNKPKPLNERLSSKPPGAGKGDAPRHNLKAYADGWDAIFSKKKNTKRTVDPHPKD